jgi:hypothetical protein
MAMITYDNKSTLNPQPSVANANKVSSGDMNEIKSVVNTNYGEVGDITNLTTTNKTSVVNAINELKGGEVYSTNEINTGKTWIDGKPIYRRIYQKTSTAATENIDIDNWNVDFVCLFVPLLYDSTNRQFDTNYYVNSNDYLRALTRLYNNKFTITVQRGNSNSRTLTIIMEYTKA